MMGGVFIAPFPATYRYGWNEKQATAFCLDELDHLFATQTHPGETAAMLIEPVQGESGYIPANAAFLQGLRERCNRHNMLLMIDEVQTGNGRTGRYWGHQHFSVQPDVVVTAKGLASGFPLSCFGASEELMARGSPGSQGGTYGANAVACAAALATLDIIAEESLVENAEERGRQLMRLLKETQRDYSEIADVRGKGLMLGTEIVDDEGNPDGKRAAAILRACEERGLLMIRCGPYGKQVVRWLPPLIVNGDQINWAVECFRESLDATKP